MNLHLLFVHFPIALLIVYALLEIISIKKLQSLTYWFYIKGTLVISGVISAFITLQTGEMIEGKFKYLKDLVEKHSDWATFSTWLFAIVAVSYAVMWVNKEWNLQGKTIKYITPVWNMLSKLAVYVQKRPVIFVLALIGLVGISVTGALGGAISQGPDVDPVVHFVYYLFFTK